jgi:cell division protein ZipA
MDFGIRELLILIGAIFFVAILADAVRRFLDNRKKQLKLLVKPGANDGVEEDNIDWYAGELPAGGVRLRTREEKRSREEKENNFLSDSEQIYNKNQSSKANSKFTEPFDILMADNKRKSEEIKAEPSINLQTFSDEVDDETEEEQRQPQVKSEQAVVYAQQKQDAVTQRPSAKQEISSGTVSQNPASRNASSQNVRKSKEKNQWDLFNKEHSESDSAIIETNKHLPEEVISINVMAKGSSQIDGGELLSALLAYGLRFGEMNIFHRHELSSGQGPVIFSMASALNPGTFDLETMPQSSFKGVTFFMRLSQIKKRIFVLELMLDIAKRLANQLNAELKDDTHSVLSSQTVSHYKTRIQEYERRYLGQVLRNDN